MIDPTRFEQLLERERPRLVRLCGLLSGSREAAEDLAQETLLQAWAHAERLKRWDAPAGWLAAIARNVCRAWARRHRHEQARRIDGATEPLELAPAAVDIELDLERAELASLLDRALALLPPDTRAVLVGKYVAELSQRELAARLGLSETAVAVRLHRGKLAFRRVLAHELRADASAYGLVDAQSPWRPTAIWCLACGQGRLAVSIAPPPGTISFRCPHCTPEPDVVMASYRLANTHFRQLLGGLRRPTAILSSATAWAHAYYRDALAAGHARCTNCGAPAHFEQLRPTGIAELRASPHFVLVVCERCGEAVSQSYAGLVMALPAVRRFWREQQRAHLLPTREVEVAGQPAVVTTLASRTGPARLAVVTALDPFRVLALHSEPDT